MVDTGFEALATAAYKGERVAARRLAGRLGLSEAQALHQVLTEVAGVAGLAPLLEQRAQLRLRAMSLRTAKIEEKARRESLRKADRLPPLAAGAWRGWFDGSAHPNPGRIGIGALLCGPAGERIEISRPAGYGNSGEAEYLALEALLEAALLNGASGLLVCGDSQVVINDVTGGDGVGARGLEAYRARVLELMRRLAPVRLLWVPRHRNGEADRLSQMAAEPGDGVLARVA